MDPPDLGAFVIASLAVLTRQIPALSSRYGEAGERLWQVYSDQMLECCDPRPVFAALELYRTTKQDKYLQVADTIVERIIALQDREGWFARSPGGQQEYRLVDEGVTPAALAYYLLHRTGSALEDRVRFTLRTYFAWSRRMADNPFGTIRAALGGEPMFFPGRDGWFGGANSAYLSTAWASFLAAKVFSDDESFARDLIGHASNQVHWVLGINPLNLCMFEGQGNSERILYHHPLAETHPRGAIPGAIPNGIAREPGNSDRPWFDFRTGIGSLPVPETCEPWLPHNAFYLLLLSAEPTTR